MRVAICNAIVVISNIFIEHKCSGSDMYAKIIRIDIDFV